MRTNCRVEIDDKVKTSRMPHKCQMLSARKILE